MASGGIGSNFNPMAVAMKQPTGTGMPYLGGSAPPRQAPNPTQGVNPFQNSNMRRVNEAKMPGAQPNTPPSTTVGAESIRATGTGPFDAAYRQNLATYAGGQFSRPGGSMSFNPTDPSTFPGLPTGGGTAPVTGMPNSLLDMALGGQPFSWTPPAPANPPASGPTTKRPQFGDMQQWLDQFMRGGRNLRIGSAM